MKRVRFSDRWITLCLLVISIFGVIMIGSASVNETGQGNRAVMNMFKQGLFVASGLVLLLIFKKMFHSSSLKFNILVFGYLVILAAMIFCLAFDNEHGGHSWIPLGPIGTIQPAEFAKPFIIILLGYCFTELPRSMQISPYLKAEEKKKMKLIKKMICLYAPLFACVVLVAVCLFLQGDLGTAVIMAAITVVCFFGASDRYYRVYQRRILALMIVVIVIGIIAFPFVMNLLKEYQKARIYAWLDPLYDPLNNSYHQINGLIAFAKNGFMGSGLGNSTQKFGYIPEAYNDYISAIIFEELGLFGLAMMLIPNFIIIWRLFHYASKVGDSRDRIILSGIGSYFFFHLFLNLGGVSCLIPETGIPLLCISMGGSATWSAYIAIGIAQSIIVKYNRNRLKAEQGLL